MSTKSKIQQIVNSREWKNDVVYYNLVMENGEKINIGKKTQLNVGDDLEYVIHDSGHEYHKAKSPDPNVNNGTAPSAPTSNTQGGLNTQETILYQVCLKGAMDYLIATFDPTIANTTFDGRSVNALTKDIFEVARQNIKNG